MVLRRAKFQTTPRRPGGTEYATERQLANAYGLTERWGRDTKTHNGVTKMGSQPDLRG
jgi:hypothetical protein